MKKFIICFVISILSLVTGWFSAIWYLEEKLLKRAGEVIAVVEESNAYLKETNEARKNSDEISLYSRLEIFTDLVRLYGNNYSCRNSLLEVADTLRIDKYQSDHTPGFSLRSKKNQSNKFAVDYEESLSRIMLNIENHINTADN